MFKDDKNYITDADIKKQLEFENKGDFIYMLVLFPLFIICLALFIGFGSYTLSFLPDNFCAECFGGLVVCLASFAFMAFCIWYLVASIKNVYKTKNSSFTVVKDKLVRIEERTVTRGQHTSILKIFHFRDYGEYQVTAKDGSAFSYSSEDDIFYLVYIEGNAGPSLAYNSKIYDYRKNP